MFSSRGQQPTRRQVGPRSLAKSERQSAIPQQLGLKSLEPGKWVRVSSWVGAEEAKSEILESVRRFNEKQGKV